MGMEVVALLQKYRVPSYPIFKTLYPNPKNYDKKLVDTKKTAWPVYSIYHPGDTDFYPYTTSHGISSEGHLINEPTIGTTTVEGRSVRYISQGSRQIGPHYGLDIIKGDDFKRGIASLISGGGPYERQEKW